MILKNRICILFLHHNKSDVTLNNFNLIKKYNPTKNIYPIGFEGNDLIEGSHVVKNCKKTYPSNNLLFSQINCNSIEWYEADILIYDFFKFHPNLPVYFVIEWDTYCNCSLEEFYGDKLKLNNFSNSIETGDKLKKWLWYIKLSEEQKTMDNLAGMNPTTCMLFTNKLLSLMVSRLTSNPRKYDNMFSEIRLGTLVQQCGYKLNQILDENISCVQYDVRINKRGYYHPVKNIIL